MTGSQKSVKRYAVKAIFGTVQGEGFWAGRSAVFVRFTGCNMWDGIEEHRAAYAARNRETYGRPTCAEFCDTDFSPFGARKLTAAEIVEEILSVAGGTDFVVLTGGEPLMQADGDLFYAMHRAALYVAVETNGTKEVKFDGAAHFDGPDWITCSPKTPAEHLRLSVCNELKLVVPVYTPEDFAEWAEHHVDATACQKLLWVQPEDGPRFEESARQCVDIVRADHNWRVSIQGHKVIDAP